MVLSLKIQNRCTVEIWKRNHDIQKNEVYFVFQIMETILAKAASQPLESFLHFSQTFGGSEHIRALLTCTTAQGVRSNSAVLLHLSRVLAALTYGNAEKMALLCDHFSSVTDFNKFDFEHSPEDEHKVLKSNSLMLRL